MRAVGRVAENQVDRTSFHGVRKLYPLAQAPTPCRSREKGGQSSPSSWGGKLVQRCFPVGRSVGPLLLCFQFFDPHWSKGPSVPTLGGSGTRCAASGYHSHTCSLYPSPLAICSEGLRVGGSDGCGWVLCGVLVLAPRLGLAPLPGGRGAAPPPVGGGAPAALGGCTWWVVSRPAFAMPSIIALMGT